MIERKEKADLKVLPSEWERFWRGVWWERGKLLIDGRNWARGGGGGGGGGRKGE